MASPLFGMYLRHSLLFCANIVKLKAYSFVRSVSSLRLAKNMPVETNPVQWQETKLTQQIGSEGTQLRRRNETNECRSIRRRFAANRWPPASRNATYTSCNRRSAICSYVDVYSVKYSEANIGDDTTDHHPEDGLTQPHTPLASAACSVLPYRMTITRYRLPSSRAPEATLRFLVIIPALCRRTRRRRRLGRPTATSNCSGASVRRARLNTQPVHGGGGCHANDGLGGKKCAVLCDAPTFYDGHISRAALAPICVCHRHVHNRSGAATTPAVPFMDPPATKPCYVLPSLSLSISGSFFGEWRELKNKARNCCSNRQTRPRPREKTQKLRTLILGQDGWAR